MPIIEEVLASAQAVKQSASPTHGHGVRLGPMDSGLEHDIGRWAGSWERSSEALIGIWTPDSICFKAYLDSMSLNLPRVHEFPWSSV